MKTSRPAVTVVIPTYNHAPLLRLALQSVQDQTLKEWEAVIVNNFSQDNTVEVVASFQDPRMRLVNFRNHGIIGASRNEGGRQAKGDILAFLDSDDTWGSRKLERVMAIFRSQPGVDLVCHDLVMTAPGKKERLLRCGPAKNYEGLLFGKNFLFTSAVSLRRSRFLELGGFSEDPGFVGSEDLELWLRLTKAGCRLEYLHEVLGTYCVHGQNFTAKTDKVLKNSLTILDRHFQEWQPKSPVWRYLLRRRRSDLIRGAGRACVQQGNFPQAKQFLLKALAEDPISWKAWALLGLSLMKVRLS
jgi:glycosyltransferase involved in cell wall biosynthesis